jgi:Family of unknown function (DUF6254)
LIDEEIFENEIMFLGENISETLCKRSLKMTQSKSQQERQWAVRKQSQNPHGKVKSFEQLAEEAGKKQDK